MNGSIRNYEDWKALGEDERAFATFMAIDRMGKRVNRLEKITYGAVSIVMTAFLLSLTNVFG